MPDDAPSERAPTGIPFSIQVRIRLGCRQAAQSCACCIRLRSVMPQRMVEKDDLGGTLLDLILLDVVLLLGRSDQ